MTLSPTRKGYSPAPSRDKETHEAPRCALARTEFFPSTRVYARVPDIGSPLGGKQDESADPDDQASARLDPESVKAIGLALRAYYRALTEEPLPARP